MCQHRKMCRGNLEPQKKGEKKKRDLMTMYEIPSKAIKIKGFAREIMRGLQDKYNKESNDLKWFTLGTAIKFGGEKIKETLI